MYGKGGVASNKSALCGRMISIGVKPAFFDAFNSSQKLIQFKLKFNSKEFTF